MKSSLQKEKLSCPLQETTSTRPLTTEHCDDPNLIDNQVLISLKSIGHRYYHSQLDSYKYTKRRLRLTTTTSTLRLPSCKFLKWFTYNYAGSVGVQ